MLGSRLSRAEIAQLIAMLRKLRAVLPSD